MNINRNNYEEFFLLYADNELSAAQKQAVDAFVAEHTDLKAELEMILQTVLPIEHMPVFLDKESLFRTTDTQSLVNPTNYESYFVQYADDELTNEEKAATEQFVYKHPECQEEFELILQAKFQPDTQIQFPDKSLLYRTTETERRPLIALWIRYAVAAALILVTGLIWLQQQSNTTVQQQQQIAALKGATKPVKETNSLINPVKKGQETEKQQIASLDKTGQRYQPGKKVIEKLAANPVREITPAIKAVQSADPPLADNPANHENPATDQSTIDALAANLKPGITVDKPIVEETGKAPTEAYPSNAAKEDYIYVANTTTNRKTPLRGFLRKASRYVEQNNPLSSEHKKGGVFTASYEQ